jgi:hypothetical protein
MKKLLIGTFIILLIVIVVELYYYLWLNNRGKEQSININNVQSEQSFKPTTVPRRPSLSQGDLALINNPYNRSFFPVSYDEVTDRLYIDMKPKNYVGWLRLMGINFAAWASISTYTKSQVESLTVQSRLKGTIARLDTNKIINGKRYLYFVLIGGGDKPTRSEYKENEQSLKKIKFVQLIDGQEIPFNWETELKNGDKIIMEGKGDLTKAPNDPDFLIEAKFIKL